MDQFISFFRDTLDGPLYIVVVVIAIILFFACIGYLAEKSINNKKEKEKYAEVNSSEGFVQVKEVSDNVNQSLDINNVASSSEVSIDNQASLDTNTTNVNTNSIGGVAPVAPGNNVSQVVEPVVLQNNVSTPVSEPVVSQNSVSEVVNTEPVAQVVIPVINQENGSNQ